MPGKAWAAVQKGRRKRGGKENSVSFYFAFVGIQKRGRGARPWRVRFQKGFGGQTLRDYYPSHPVRTFFFFSFRDRVSLCSPGCPGTHVLDQIGLELRNSLASASQMLGLKPWATTARLLGNLVFLEGQPLGQAVDRANCGQQDVMF